MNGASSRKSRTPKWRLVPQMAAAQFRGAHPPVLPAGIWGEPGEQGAQRGPGRPHTGTGGLSAPARSPPWHLPGRLRPGSERRRRGLLLLFAPAPSQAPAR